MKQSLRLRFSIGFIGLALGPILLMGVLYGYLAYQEHINLARYRQQELAHRIGVEAEVVLRQLQQGLQHASEHPDFLSGDLARQEKLLNTLLVTSKQFTELAVVDHTGYEVLRLSLSHMRREEMSHLRDLDEVFQRVNDSQQFASGAIYFEPRTGEPLMTMAYPLFDLYSGQFQGVLLGVGRLKSLWELVQRNNGSPDDDIYLLDEPGRVIAHKNPSVVLRGSEFTSFGRNSIEPGLAGQPMVIGSYPFSFGGQTLRVVAELSARIALAPAMTTLKLLLSTLLLALLLAAVLIYLAIRHVISPIHTLSATVRRMRDGDLSLRVPVDSSDELGELGLAFNSLAANLDASIRSLAESESLYRLLVENQNDLIAKFDGQGVFSFVSETYCETFGKRSEELLGNSFLPLIHDEDRERIQASLSKLSQPPYTTSHEERALTPQGYRWFSWSARGVLDENGELKEVISVGRDITERKQLESERTEIEAQLRQAQKMEAIGQLTGGIAHDFNNILASILGFTLLAKQKYGEQEGMEPLERYLDEIDKAGIRAKDLVTQMLNFSRAQGGELIPLALKPLVGEDIRMLRSIIPTSIDISVECEPELPKILVDPIQLHQVIMNLCINARDAIGQKGEIKLSLYHRELSGQHCNACNGGLEGHFVELAVSDNGSGISEENQRKIFEPFFSTKAPGKGTGMGLHTVSGIVHEAKGHILLDSRLGEGSRFRLFFPVHEQQEAEVAVPAPVSRLLEVPEQQRGRILVVDDEATVANLMRELLGSSGYQVITASSGAEALRLLDEQDEVIDLVISDHHMPGMSGVELAQELLRYCPSLAVILTTGFKGGIDETELRQTNVKEIMQKPLQLRELLKVVQQNIHLNS